MSLGKRDPEQERRWQAARRSLSLTGHPFYQRLDFALGEAGFDAWVEALCGPFYASRRGRPSVPPGTYFRMRLIGHVEEIPSQRALAWRCADSLSLREFLGVGPQDPTPDHSTLTVIRRRIPEDVQRQVMTFLESVARNLGMPLPRIPALAALPGLGGGGGSGQADSCRGAMQVTRI